MISALATISDTYIYIYIYKTQILYLHYLSKLSRMCKLSLLST